MTALVHLPLVRFVRTVVPFALAKETFLVTLRDRRPLFRMVGHDHPSDDEAAL